MVRSGFQSNGKDNGKGDHRIGGVRFAMALFRGAWLKGLDFNGQAGFGLARHGGQRNCMAKGFGFQRLGSVKIG